MKEDILEYIGLNIKRISKTKFKQNPIQFSKFNNSKTYKVYEYISIHDLEVLITPLERTAEFKERYKTSKPLIEYLKTDDSKMEKTFQKLLNSASVEEIKEIEEWVEKANKGIPYLVRYDKNYLWQIYYSEEDKKYFMLFPANEGETSVLFYIIKKKLEKKDTKIFVPINNIGYCEEMISTDKINDIENYIWLLTNEWPNIYEVNKQELYVTGKAKIKGVWDSYYRNIYTSKDEVENFYILLKAIFILITETNYKYSFEPYINKKGELELKHKGKIINATNLPKFVDEQADTQKRYQAELEKEIDKNEKELKSLKEYVKKQNEIYVMQEKQIVMFLQCKKSFFKRLSYFFKSKKFTTPKINEENKQEENNDIMEVETGGAYTISELVSIVIQANKIETKARDIKADISSLKIKKENLARKIKNASNYITEIEKHKKSIFEFWKFSNKDALPALEMGEIREESKRVQGVFNTNKDLEVLGTKADECQRRKLSSEECNAIYIANKDLNLINFTQDDKILETELKKLKSRLNKSGEILDNLLDNYSEGKKINNKEHRESSRNELRILKISEETKLDEFRNEIQDKKTLLKEAYNKIRAIEDIDIYIRELDMKNEYCIGEINPKKILEETDKNLKLYKVKLKQDQHLIYFSNIIFFTNNNQTLPLGMDISTKVLIKTPQIDYEKTNKEDINILIKEDDFNYKTRQIEIIKTNQEQI